MNIKPLNASIAFKRLEAKHKFSDYKLAEFVEHFWTRSKWPISYYNRGKSTQEIIKEELLPWLVRGCNNSLRSNSVKRFS